MKRIIDVMCRCHLFDGIPEDKYKNVLNCLNAQLKTYAKDAVILHIGEQQGRPGVVVSGTLTARTATCSPSTVSAPGRSSARPWLVPISRKVPCRSML